MAELEASNLNERHKFPSEERLKSKKLIEELFNKGSSIHLYPYRIFFLPGPAETTTGMPQLLISIPKRNFKKAVDRNRIRRQIREIYRLNRTLFYKKTEFPPSRLA